MTPTSIPEALHVFGRMQSSLNALQREVRALPTGRQYHGSLMLMRTAATSLLSDIGLLIAEYDRADRQYDEVGEPVATPETTEPAAEVPAPDPVADMRRQILTCLADRGAQTALQLKQYIRENGGNPVNGSILTLLSSMRKEGSVISDENNSRWSRIQS